MIKLPIECRLIFFSFSYFTCSRLIVPCVSTAGPPLYFQYFHDRMPLKLQIMLLFFVFIYFFFIYLFIFFLFLFYFIFFFFFLSTMQH